MRSYIKYICVFITFAFSTKALYAQSLTPRYVSMIDHSNAYYEYLPQGYPEANKKYPLLLFFHGLAEIAQGTPTSLPYLLNTGPCKEINNGTFPVSFTVNGQNFKFIVITPQFTEWPTEADADNVITWLVANYPIDINRIYITGLSMGGGVVWNYAGKSALNANRLAAIVPVCGAAWPDGGHANIIAAANLPVWATHNDPDPTCPVWYTQEFVRLINAFPVTPNPQARQTIFPVSPPSHDAWTVTYSPGYKENGLNIYEWMLQYQRNFTVLPVSGLEFFANLYSPGKILLNWKTVTELNNPRFDIQRSIDGINFNTIQSINSKGNNGGGAVYNFTDTEPFQGSNFYRLQVTDADGKISYSNIQNIEITNTGVSIAVYPNPATTVINIAGGIGFSKRTLQIRNINGQLVHTELINSPVIATINIAALPAGIYYGTVIENNQKQFFNFVKK